MFIAAFALGLWFGWLLDAVARYRAERWSNLIRYRRRIAAALFVVVFAIYYFSIVAGYLQYGDNWASRLVRYLTTPPHLRAALWFALGAIVYHFRGAIGTFIASLLLGSSETSTTGALVPRKWLTTAGGLPIL